MENNKISEKRERIDPNDINRKFARFLRQISYYDVGQMKSDSRELSIMAFSFGLVNDVSEFFKKTSVVKKANNITVHKKRKKQVLYKRVSKKSYKEYCEAKEREKPRVRRNPGYGSQSQITRKSWGSAFKPARG